MMNKSILTNSLYKVCLDLLRIIIPIISMPYIYRVFNPEIMGNLEFSLSISNYFFLFAGFGVYTFGLREVSRVRNDNEKRNKLFTSLFLISTISTILVCFFYLVYIYIEFNKEVVLKNMLLINGIQLASYIFYIEWINEAFENYRFISYKSIIVKLLNLICLFLFIKNSNDYYRYLLLINVFIFINNFISFIYINKYINFNFKKIEIKKYLIPLATILFISNINMFYTQLDRIALGFYANNVEQVAYYGVARNIMQVLMTVLMAAIIVTMPRLSFYLGQGDKKSYENLFNRVFPFVYAMLFPIGIGIIVLSREIALFFGGESYLPAQTVLIIFGIRLIVVTIESLLSNHVIFLHQKERIMVYILGACAIVNFFMKYWLIKNNNFDAVTAISTTMIAEIIIILMDYYYIKKHLKLNIELFKLKNLKYLLYSLIFLPISYIVKLFNLSYFFTIIIIFIICFIIYIVILLITKDEQLNELFIRLKIR